MLWLAYAARGQRKSRGPSKGRRQPRRVGVVSPVRASARQTAAISREKKGWPAVFLIKKPRPRSVSFQIFGKMVWGVMPNGLAQRQN